MSYNYIIVERYLNRTKKEIIMTIAEKIKLSKNQGQIKYLMECKKRAVSSEMSGPDFKIFTFEDGSKIEMYWS